MVKKKAQAVWPVNSKKAVKMALKNHKTKIIHLGILKWWQNSNANSYAFKKWFGMSK